ncbi:MAG: hypothetical protein H7Y32_02790 [Chloroflexales bacterium]|nr:hypothetical protein [Chloroflexales bacterium]
MGSTREPLGGALALAALLIVGAATLKLYERGQPLPTEGIAWLLTTDWVHVPAHLLLYGALTAYCARAFGGRGGPTVLAVTIVALAQEGCQSLLFGRAPGWAEAFDLGVDALAVVVTLRLYRALWLGPRAWRVLQ